MRAQLSQRHLLGIRGLSAEEITHILDTAETFREVSEREIKKVPTLRGRTVINLFFEPSTRTRTSFEIAGKRLSADVINISSSSSSVTKGETLVILEAINGSAFALFYPADTSIIPLTVSEDQLQEANALIRLGTNATMIAGAALAAHRGCILVRQLLPRHARLG